MGNVLSIIDGVNTIECVNINGLDNIEEELNLNSDGTITFSTSNEITIFGKSDPAYLYLFEHFFNCVGNCNADDVKFQLYLECCDKVFNFVLSSDMLEWCPEICRIEINLLSSSNIENCRECLNGRYWWFEYFDDKSFADADVIYYWSLDDNGITWNRYPTYLFRDILTFNLEKCGITLQSTLLQQAPYTDLALTFSAGGLGAAPNSVFGLSKLSTLSALQLIQNVAKLMNAQILFTEEDGNCVMIFEREDYFKDNSNFTIIPYSFFNAEDELCLKYAENEKLNCFSTKYMYETYGVTDYRNETRLIYESIVNWNSNEVRNERCEKEIPFHAPAFLDTGLLNRLTPDELDPNVPIVTIYSGTGTGTATVLGDSAFPISNGGTDFNYPLYFSNNLSDNLVDNFHYIDNPDLQECVLEASNSSISIQPNGTDLTFCEFRDILSTEGLFVGFSLDNCDYVIKPSTIKIKYSSGLYDIENIGLT